MQGYVYFSLLNVEYHRKTNHDNYEKRNYFLVLYDLNYGVSFEGIRDEIIKP
ncbi:hypothetical protein HLPCO_001075 [Haloplasma contractile SSD-17B]|uniref:Uncharacterized protein n=1 Tax=Haloplasma contractile SSD-17B TaxID=1033810 RepID=U2FIQ6_9MOLU|nr:hypothetical protein HLPCO_001075 [Haloplasma contractile SSD-17B]